MAALGVIAAAVKLFDVGGNLGAGLNGGSLTASVASDSHGHIPFTSQFIVHIQARQR